MTTQFATDLVAISTSDLGTVTGGDAGGDYTHQLKQDLYDTGKREHEAVDAAKQGQWGTAAKRGVQAFVNDVKTISDAAKPIKDLIGLGK